MREIFISIGENKFRIFTKNLSSKNIPLVLLHGFAGSASVWEILFDKLENLCPIIAIDLIGHGKTSAPDNPIFYSEESQISQLNKIFEELEIEKFILLGYSMGGRLALSYSLNNTNKIIGLILESSTAGIQNDDLRKERYENDLLISEKIRTENLIHFFKNWYSASLFNSLKNIPSKLDELILRKSKNNRTGLANSLIGFSTGKMKNYWSEIQKFQKPVLLICGNLDQKYYDINLKLNSLFPNSNLAVIKDSGHITHLEKPDEFVNLVNSFLRTFYQQD